MQNDEVIFHILRHKHCSFMSKITTGIFCRNPYNLTGICNRSSCPLANSRYATIREDNGVFYLYMKSIERAHTPNKLWERVKLPRNYEKALEIIDKHLMYFPKFLAHKAKQRLTKMTQMRIRMRKLALKTREKIMTTPRKEIKREARREQKAETAAVLEKAIEKELVERLTKGLYGTSIYNLQQNVFDKVLDMDEFNVDKEVEMEDEFEEGVVEYVEGDEIEDDMEDFPGLPDREIGNAGDDSNEDEDEDEDEGTVALNRKRSRKDSKFALKKAEKDNKDNSKSKKKAKVIVEVEHEATDLRQTETA